MQAPSGSVTAPALQALLGDGTLAGAWVLDPRTTSIRLKTRIMGLVRVNGVFREVSGNGTVFPDGEVSGNNPDITFATDGIRPSGHGVAVTGALTVRGRTRPPVL